jgi:hypothetical protein
MTAYLYDGANVGIRQVGKEPLALVIAYRSSPSCRAAQGSGCPQGPLPPARIIFNVWCFIHHHRRAFPQAIGRPTPCPVLAIFTKAA